MGLAYGEHFSAQPTSEFWNVPSLEEAEAAWRARQAPGYDFDFLWRVEAVSYAVRVDPYEGEDWTSTPPRLELFGVSVKHRTPCGARLWSGRWVSLRPGKQYASETPAEALLQFTLRRRAQIRILEKQLARAQRELWLATGKETL
jgi:hypothetical protein